MPETTFCKMKSCAEFEACKSAKYLDSDLKMPEVVSAVLDECNKGLRIADGRDEVGVVCGSMYLANLRSQMESHNA